MRAESRFTCCLIGQQSLLILCAENLLARGHAIRGVATESDDIRKWAASRSVPVLPSSNDRLTKLLTEGPCDYLFSVINYRVLPDHIFRLPKRGAINFHDGPLPGYAGMYVTTWALINGEREHGISWHWMTKEIDAGGVLIEKRFPLSRDETAFTLNIKCYKAGFEAFRSLLNDLDHGTVSSRPQTRPAQGGYYGLRKRPGRMATLDWSRPAEELDALFRSLDFGRYENPIGCAKVVWGDQILIPGRLSVLEQTSSKPPGTWEHRPDRNAVGVHTSTKIVELAALGTLDGEPVEISSLASLSHEEGRTHRLEETAPVELDQLLERICVHESFWAARLATREAVAFPYVPAEIRRDQSPTKRIHRGLDGRSLCAAGDSSKFVARAVAAISLYLGRLSGKEAFDLDYQSASPAGLPRESALYFATTRPLRIRLNWPGSFAEHVGQLETAISELEKRGTYARDLVLRYPQITQEHRQRLREIPDVAVAVRPNSLDDVADLPKAQLAFLISHSELKIGLVANADVFDERLLDKIAEELAHVVAQIGTSPQAVLADVAVVAPSEQAVLDGWNEDTRVNYEPTSLPRMFESQVERTPDAMAVVFRGECVSYRELNVRANQLANLLIARGVKRGDLVGALMDRSVEMVVSLFAVLKTGAAYVPTDPAYPPHRLAIMVEDASPHRHFDAGNSRRAVRCVQGTAGIRRSSKRIGRPECRGPFRRHRAGRRGLRHVHLRLDRAAQGGHGHSPEHPEFLSDNRSQARQRSAGDVAGAHKHLVRHLDPRVILDADAGGKGDPSRIRQKRSLRRSRETSRSEDRLQPVFRECHRPRRFGRARAESIAARSVAICLRAWLRDPS